ncbi:MAG TPA: TRAP transporter small permease [Burkholderiaceae bacterium]|nr:TRAP transporter small permease [Burkholderiaceae bacterium]
MTFDDPVGRTLERLAQALAVLGGLALTGVALMSLYSVAMRNLAGAPIQGDFELAQVGCAVSVAAFLPFTQLRNGNIFVDFFTQRASAGTKAALDGIGAVVVGLGLALLAWRTGAGGLDAWRNDETTMLMGLPTWYGYLAMTPSFAVASAAAFYSAWRHWALHEVAEPEERS